MCGTLSDHILTEKSMTKQTGRSRRRAGQDMIITDSPHPEVPTPTLPVKHTIFWFRTFGWVFGRMLQAVFLAALLSCLQTLVQLPPFCVKHFDLADFLLPSRLFHLGLLCDSHFPNPFSYGVHKMCFPGSSPEVSWTHFSYHT